MIGKVTTTSNLKPDRGDINTDIGYKFGDDVGLSTDTKATDSITPLPGGVGSLTIAMLTYHTIETASRRSVWLSSCPQGSHDYCRQNAGFTHD
jgi:5,10-methylene-tetrahydrofolate dehydrogenase/Methenyl tetrahydrofolate cyclohydrolase